MWMAYLLGMNILQPAMFAKGSPNHYDHYPVEVIVDEGCWLSFDAVVRNTIDTNKCTNYGRSIAYIHMTQWLTCLMLLDVSMANNIDYTDMYYMANNILVVHMDMY